MSSPASTAGRNAVSARHPLNLIDQLTRDAVVSDYAAIGTQPPVDPSRSRRQQLIVAGLGLALAGFVLATGLSTQLVNRPVVRQQREALLARLEQAEVTQAALAEELAILRPQAEADRRLSLELSAAGQGVSAQVALLEVATGYTAVTGPGVIVTMSDGSASDAASGDDPELSRVLDSDLQTAVNGLWRAGAEAIAINGQRLSAQSAIRSAAGAVLVNYRPLRPPYEVTAIGGESLAERFAATADAADLAKVAKQFGIGFRTDVAQTLELPAAAGVLPDTARVTQEEKQ
ncbi:MAG: DUF881 domain-containing protein [Candidatus Nanopelagicales bacterium]